VLPFFVLLKGEVMFENLVDSKPQRSSRKLRTWWISGLLHLGALLILLVTPLIRYAELTAASPLTYLAKVPSVPAPEPPTAPLQPSEEPIVTPVPVILLDDPRLADGIPEPPDIEPGINWQPLPGLISPGFPGGAPGRLDGLSGASGSLIPGAELLPLAPPPPGPSAPEPLRVGGTIQQARKIVHVQPEYPELARRARVGGIVLIEALIDEAGSVKSARLLRGHPLLSNAALTAVRQWKYSPTLLNGEPVAVMTTISVDFSLR
jgi:protein TonB